jgi:hypothetical protein
MLTRQAAPIGARRGRSWYRKFAVFFLAGTVLAELSCHRNPTPIPQRSQNHFGTILSSRQLGQSRLRRPQLLAKSTAIEELFSAVG